ncbi:iron-siderophore ABC transporter substrate-binding protein [Reinekea marinisedimentorum]|uniref:Iron complex transport system substrate-binding protein n=1 Tax=Reinekea marinisedimentorum TaxID=230495 RepID=A0A4R3HWV2_9GAMM|nr:iron-siderophore ABC transporter substrate-binding protein [Reinekea marinisedimentorum]TCS36741.1 iron complex transport system substrate-binding protein [Reinekea marinisedimentorum]
MMKTLITPLLFTLSAALLAAPVQVEDSRGSHSLPDVPQRVAALNWDIAEQVIELGVTPVAMPNIADYTAWVAQPAVPEGVEDIGTRMEPNLERLAQLQPDVIIIASPQIDLVPKLEQIAPVLLYHTYNESHDNAQAAIENFRRMAAALGKEAEAEQRLTAMSQRLNELKAQLSEAYLGQLPRVVAFRFASLTSVYVYGDNSIPQYALAQLGVAPAWPQPATQWGVTQKRLKALGQLPAETVALYYQPFDEEAKLQTSKIWQALPFVRNGGVNSVAPAWNYGGAMSILYNAEVLAEALLAVAPEK